MKKPEDPGRPVCSICAEELRDGGFRVQFEKNAQLHMDTCSVCGRRFPVHLARITGAGRRKQKNIP